MKNLSLVWPVVVGAATLGWSLNQQGQAQPTNPTVPAAPAIDGGAVAPIARRADAFTPISKAIVENNLPEAAAQLKTMKANGLSPDQITRWETLAARVAVRLADTQWLKEINRSGNLATGADELVTLSATRLLFANRLEETRSTLEGIKEPYQMSEIPRRRYEQLYLKLEQLEGNREAEAKWAGKLVEFVSGWEGQNCQSCHANERAHGKEVTQFPLQNWWVGERYATLMRENGSAGKIEKEAREALGKNPKDEAAQIRLGYALRALGRAKESEAALREIPWSSWADRPYKKPLRLAQFP